MLGHRGWGLGISLVIRSDSSAVAVTRLGFVNSTQYDDPKGWNDPMKDSIPFSAEQKVEDGYVWQAKDGSFHALFHAFNSNWQGSHAFSPDGSTWHYSGAAYNNSVTFSDGTVGAMTRRERPHLIFDQDTVNGSKRILGLINGVVDSADPGEYGDKSFTLVTPVRQKSDDDDVALLVESLPMPVQVPDGVLSSLFAVSAAMAQSKPPLRYAMTTYHEHDYHVAHLTATSAVEVSVRVLHNPAAKCAVRPRRLAIDASSGPAGSVFTVPAPTTRPYFLMVECTGVDDKLLVLVDAPAPVPATPAGAARVSIMDFGADPSGAKDSTAAIQHALDVSKTQDQAALVVVPPGHFMTTDTLIVHSNTTLFMQAGAVIRSTSDRSLLPKPSSTSSCTGKLVSMMSLAPGASSVTIAGLGRLDANGFALMTADVAGNCSAAKGWLHRRRVLDSQKGGAAHHDIRISGITLADSTTWTLAIEDVDRMSVHAVKVLNHKNVTVAKIENDGLDLVSVRDALVSFCFVMTVDDAMCAKAHSTATRNNTFADNTVFTRYASSVSTLSLYCSC